MPTLEACKEMIAELSEAKKWSKDPNIKFLYAFVELGEAVDAWKKRKPPSKVIEEIIDAIYYLIHCAWCINPHTDLDQLFINKHRINYKRRRKYPNDTTEGDEANGDEGPELAEYGLVLYEVCRGPMTASAPL